jgi:hypothetical protein
MIRTFPFKESTVFQTELMELLRHEDAKPGDVFEAHRHEGELGQVLRTSAAELHRSWAYCLGEKSETERFFRDCAHKGLVGVAVIHEDGAYLLGVEVEAVG